VLNACLISNQPFVDDSFMPGMASLYGTQVATMLQSPDIPDHIKFESPYPPLAWRRISQIRYQNRDPGATDRFSNSATPWTVVRDRVNPADIQQGALGDCWFLSALSVLAERPLLVLNLLLTPEYSPQGVYLVRFCKNGVWTVVMVDDFFPTDSHGGLAYACGRSKQMWVPLLEKAYAKLHGSYSAIVAGQMYEALADLTGAPCETLSLEDITADLDMTWAQLRSFRESGFLMGASCGRSAAIVDSKGVPLTPSALKSYYESVGLQRNHGTVMLLQGVVITHTG